MLLNSEADINAKNKVITPFVVQYCSTSPNFELHYNNDTLKFLIQLRPKINEILKGSLVHKFHL